MNSKILLLSIAVISVGLFAMPSTLSLFNGQHTFYDGSQVDCTKCHADVETEISGATSTAHKNPTLQECKGCHLTGTLTNVIPAGDNKTNISFSLNITQTNAHAAITLECVTCHRAVPTNITDNSEAHRKFYLSSAYSINTSAFLAAPNQTNVALKGANTACIGCHTHAVVNVTWQRSVGYNVTADSRTGDWVLTFTANNSAYVNRSSSGE